MYFVIRFLQNYRIRFTETSRHPTTKQQGLDLADYLVTYNR